jgi:hypothetical protein
MARQALVKEGGRDRFFFSFPRYIAGSNQKRVARA